MSDSMSRFERIAKRKKNRFRVLTLEMHTQLDLGFGT